jgi:hypothetical protein
MATYTRTEIAIRSMVTAKGLFEKGLITEATVLAGSAHHIVRDICRHKGIEPSEDALTSMRNRPVKETVNIINSVYNNLKHADKNTDELVEVPDDEPLFLIKLGCINLMRMKVDDIRVKLLFDYIGKRIEN